MRLRAFILLFSFSAIFGYVASDAVADGSPVDSIDVWTLGGNAVTCSPDPTNSLYGLLLFNNPHFYHLADSTTFEAGAGSVRYNYGLKTDVSVSGSNISYSLTPRATDNIMLQVSQAFYNSSNDDTVNGQFILASPLVLQANSGSSTATLSGYLQLTQNDYRPNASHDYFHFFDAPIGSIVPFTLTYTLIQGTWSPTTFDGAFQYHMSGTINLTAAVPEPSTFALLAIGAIGLLKRRRSIVR